MTNRVSADALALATFVLRLTFVILTAVGFAVSALLIALAYAFERLYAVPALLWALATLAFPACGLIVLALSTRLARFVAGNFRVSHTLRSAMREIDEIAPPNKALEQTGGEAVHRG
jgi:hypothetical protein